jgi:hypothetical protein
MPTRARTNVAFAPRPAHALPSAPARRGASSLHDPRHGNVLSLPPLTIHGVAALQRSAGNGAVAGILGARRHRAEGRPDPMVVQRGILKFLGMGKKVPEKAEETSEVALSGGSEVLAEPFKMTSEYLEYKNKLDEMEKAADAHKAGASGEGAKGAEGGPSPDVTATSAVTDTIQGGSALLSGARTLGSTLAMAVKIDEARHTLDELSGAKKDKDEVLAAYYKRKLEGEIAEVAYHAYGSASGAITSAAQTAGTVVHVLATAGQVGSAASGMSGGVAAVVMGPLALLGSVWTAQQQLVRAIRAGSYKRKAKTLAFAREVWSRHSGQNTREREAFERRSKELKAEYAELAANKARIAAEAKNVSKRHKPAMKEDDESTARRRLVLTKLDTANVELTRVQLERPAIEEDFKAFDRIREDLEKERETKSAYSRSMTSTEPPKNVAQIQDYYINQKRKAEWRAAVEGTGATIGAIGAALGTAGGALAIVGAAGMGVGAVPGLVIAVVGGATSLLGVAVSSASFLHRAFRGAVKKMKKVKGVLRKLMAEGLVRLVHGMKPDNAKAKAGREEQDRAWMLLTELQIPGLMGRREIDKEVKKGRFDPEGGHYEKTVEMLKEKFSSQHAG